MTACAPQRPVARAGCAATPEGPPLTARQSLQGRGISSAQFPAENGTLAIHQARRPVDKVAAAYACCGSVHHGLRRRILARTCSRLWPSLTAASFALSFRIFSL